MGRPVVRCVLVVLLASSVSPFNLNDQYPRVVYRSAGNSSFGYSIAFHEHGETTWLLAGAPKASKAHRCQLLPDVSCSELPISAESDTWLGATVVSRNGRALVCSPRSGDYVSGDCFYGTGQLETFTSLYEKWQSSLGYCNVGFSAAFSASRMFLGAPSCNKNQGRTHWQNWTPPYGLNFTEQPARSEFDSFFSYAVDVVRTEGNSELLAASTVYQLSTTGSVHLINNPGSPGQSNHVIVGQQAGELFGSSLVSTDVNGDGLDDLLVGAPHFSDYDDPELKFEIGKVYVYQQSKSQQFESNPTSVLVGRATGARFGHALAALGDVNDDKFNDVAVGAPYEDGGRVYVFFGSRSGLRSEPGQVIDGRSFGLRTFGFSLTGNVDVDGNGYKDLAVGAYQSDAIVYLPARPVIRMTTLSIAFIPDQISFDDSNFLCRNIKDAVCSTLSYCLSFDGLNVAQRVTFNVSIVLDVKQSRTSRLFFADDSSSLVEALTITKNRRVCHERQVHIKRDIIDKLSPIEAAMNIQVVGHEPSSLDLPPIFDLYASNSTSNSMSIANNCGPDNECIPDLQLTIALNDTRVVQGAKQFPVLRISVLNKGEDAFESHFNMFLPETLLFKSSQSDRVLCSTPEVENGPSLQCDIGNPLPSDGLVEFVVYLEPQLNVYSENSSIQFMLEVTSKNKELNSTLDDNEASVNINLTVNTSLSVVSRPVELLFNRTLFELNGNNETTLPRFLQDYEIVNSGPSTILGANVTIDFVTHSLGGSNISALVDEPKMQEGQGICQTSDQLRQGFNVITCQLDGFSSSGRAIIRLSGQLASGISEVDSESTVSVSSRFSVVATRLPFATSASLVAPASGVARLLITEDNQPALLTGHVAWWIYAASAGGAALLLSAMSAVLNKLGFFKRNRPPTTNADTTELNAKHEENGEPAT